MDHQQITVPTEVLVIMSSFFYVTYPKDDWVSINVSPCGHTWLHAIASVDILTCLMTPLIFEFS